MNLMANRSLKMSQSSFRPIFTNYLMISMVLMAPKSPWKDFSIVTSHIFRQSKLTEILGKSVDNHYGIIY